MSEQPHYVAFKEQPALTPSPGGSSNHHDSSSLQVTVGACIERKPPVEWSVSPWVVTALMPRDSGSRGLRISDRVLAINGQSVTHMATIDSLHDLLEGPVGSSVDIVVDRVTCAPQPLALSEPRSSYEEHFGKKVFNRGEVIFEGWISKDGRFSSTFKRRWAQLTINSINWGFYFRWGEIGPAGFAENGSASFDMPYRIKERESVFITPLDHPPHGQQLPAPCSVYGFMLQIDSRTISIFCDSKFDRDIWMSVLNMAKRTVLEKILPCSIVTFCHQRNNLTPLVHYDVEISVALQTFEETRAMASSLEAEANEGEPFQQQQLEQDLLQLQSIAASDGLENQVALLTKRVQVLERQNSMMHAEARAQNAIIELLTAQTKQLQLHSANLHRQMARALYTDQYDDDDRFRQQAHKFAVNILANVLGAADPHTVAVSEEKPDSPSFESLESLHAFAASYSTTAGMNATKQKLRNASLRSNQTFQ
jgi:hypothetical protein